MGLHGKGLDGVVVGVGSMGQMASFNCSDAMILGVYPILMVSGFALPHKRKHSL